MAYEYVGEPRAFQKPRLASFCLASYVKNYRLGNDPLPQPCPCSTS